jgi:tetratricopeptide (TPR) repeat protein
VIQDAGAIVRERLELGTVLLELGERDAAEREAIEALEREPENPNALGLLAKIKHMRGELSQAVACWAQIHARAKDHSTAALHLQAILNLAKDPEAGAGEFLALGFHLVRKPAAQLALEEAFRLFLARRPDEARARCEALALANRGTDRAVYKLAVLASAWIAELSGELEVAGALLEALGRERGLELDIDRLVALVRIYERLGTREKLVAAVNVCRYLERRYERVSVLSTLAVLQRRLGDERAAAGYEKRYLAAFRAWMHRPSFEDVIRVAARQYLPLDRLRAIHLPPHDALTDLDRRGGALALALAGDLAHARTALEKGGELLDRKYVADLAWLEGRREEALSGYLEALEADPSDLRILERVLDAQEQSPTERVSRHFEDPRRAADTQRVLEAALRSAPLDPGVWRKLGTLFTMVPGGAEKALRCRERAATLTQAARHKLAPVGRVLAAAVYRFVGATKGIVHEVWAGREVTAPGRGGTLPVDQIHGNLTAEMKNGVRSTFLAVREYARTKLPHLTGDILDYTYTYKVTKEDEPSGGLSGGLPTALAFLSVFTQRPVRQDLAASGMLVADAHDVLVVQAVGDTDFKVRGAYNRNLATLLLPRANRAELVARHAVPPSVCEELVAFVSNLDEAVALVFGSDIYVPT